MKNKKMEKDYGLLIQTESSLWEIEVYIETWMMERNQPSKDLEASVPIERPATTKTPR